MSTSPSPRKGPSGRAPSGGSPPVDRSRLQVPYLTGVYLAVNAIGDVYLVVDGPNCVFFRISQVQPNHDWHADLARASGLHRIVDTDATPDRIAREDNRVLLQRLVRVDQQPDCSAILLTPMSIVALAGRQYEPLLAGLDPPLEHPVWFVPMGSLTGDWVDGYAAVLQALAEQIDLPREDAAEPEDSVALVGLLYHRNEADAQADVMALRDLVAGLGLSVASVWLEGSRLADLRGVCRARWIVSLPYGRAAARRLAERTGAELLEMDLPLGLDATVAWIRALGRATGREAEAERVVARGLGRVVPQLERVLPALLAGRRVLVAGDPHLAPALAGALRELGCRVVGVAVLGSDAHLETATQALQAWTGATPRPEVSSLGPGALERLGSEAGPGLPLDAVVGCSPAFSMVGGPSEGVARVEVGFPSYTYHAFTPQPLLGFDGVLNLVQRLANGLLAAAAPSF